MYQDDKVTTSEFLPILKDFFDQNVKPYFQVEDSSCKLNPLHGAHIGSLDTSE